MNNSTNHTSPWGRIDRDQLRRLYMANYIVLPTVGLIGFLLSVWLVVAILMSPDLRQSMRNRLICLVTFCEASMSTVLGILRITAIVHYYGFSKHLSCYVWSFALYFRAIITFANSLYVIILLIVFIAQIVDYDPSSTMTPLVVGGGKIAMLVAPIVIGTFLVPIIGALHNPAYFGKERCLYVSKENIVVIRIIDYLVPLVASVVLLVVAAVLYYRRFHRGISTAEAIKPELMGRGPRIDSITAYLAAVGIDMACRFCYATYFILEFHTDDINDRILYSFVSWTIMCSRTMLVPVAWLFLQDIRDRIKIWRPWYRPAPGIDPMTINYTKTDE